MTPNEVRAKYLEFFGARGHAILPSAPLVPENDPTTLFTGSGMQPLVPYLLGSPHPAGSRLANSQKCFRSMDIEEVGDNRHTTFFEMLGNWSLGDYFKKEQLGYFFEFLTKEIGTPKEKLWITCFEGDPSLNLPKDTESAEIWKSLGIPEERIHYYDSKKNWWSRSGVPSEMPAGEPGGPDSEVFYDFETPHDSAYGAQCHPNCDCGRFMEIGNSVFMEYVKKEDGSFEKLAQRNVDFGGGLERLGAALRGVADVFPAAHETLLHYIEQHSGKQYVEHTKAFRVVADHIKTATMLVVDGVIPGNVERGYIVRRLLRRAVRFGDSLGLPEGALGSLSQLVVEQYEGFYTELRTKAAEIQKIIDDEENRFRKTLERGLKELERFVAGGSITAQDAFQLVTTYGFPLELIVEEAGGRGGYQIHI